MTMDYTFEKRLEFQREEAVEEGRKLGEEFGIKLGEKNGMQKILHDLVRKNLSRTSHWSRLQRKSRNLWIQSVRCMCRSKEK